MENSLTLFCIIILWDINARFLNKFLECLFISRSLNSLSLSNLFRIKFRIGNMTSRFGTHTHDTSIAYFKSWITDSFDLLFSNYLHNCRYASSRKLAIGLCKHISILSSKFLFWSYSFHLIFSIFLYSSIVLSLFCFFCIFSSSLSSNNFSFFASSCFF